MSYIVTKGNKSYEIQSDLELESYLSSGFDQVDKKGKIIQYATGGKTYNAVQYNALRSENEALKAELEVLKADKPKTKEK